MTAVPRVAILTDDVLGERMAGPAIRAVEMSRALAAHQPVTLVSAVQGRVEVDGVEVADPADLRAVVDASDVIVLQGAVMMRHPWLHDVEQPIVIDLYDPFHLEALQLDSDDPVHASDIVESTVRTLSDQIVRGDFFLCATERQRDLWLGHLGALGRLNHRTRADDPDFRGLIDLVPFGLPATPPPEATDTFHDLLPAVPEGAVVAFWAGGIYDWFDPVTLIEAVAQVDVDPSLHLVFLGGRHPNPDVPEMDAAAAARSAAERLGLLGHRVHFVDDWVPYDQRQRYLAAADIGVTTHRASAETAFSFRTRVLDYLWAGLPVIGTRGDELSAVIETGGAGIGVTAGDVDELREALAALAADPARRATAAAASNRLASTFTWPDVVDPLRRFTTDPRPAADRVDPVARAAIAAHRPSPQRGVRHFAHRARLNLAAGGVARVVAALRAKLRRSSP